jgi:cyclopropane fatty-acyl-phospholipid synthase-like methyltransferase
MEDSQWKAQQIIKIMSANRLKPRTICEIGCGAGEILNELYKQLPDETSLFGYEISPQAYSICKSKAKDKLIFRHEDMLSDDKAFFDVVLAIDVVEHVEDYLGFLRKLRNKGEFKIFQIPLDMHAQGVIRNTPIVKRKRVGHLHYFSKETAISALKETGYTILDAFYTCGALDLKKKGWKTALMKLPRRLMFTLNKDISVRLLGGAALLVLAR